MTKKQKAYQRWLALVLSVVLLTNFVPISAIAQESAQMLSTVSDEQLPPKSETEKSAENSVVPSEKISASEADNKVAATEPVILEYTNHQEQWTEVKDNKLVLKPAQNSQIRLKGALAEKFKKNETFVKVDLNGVPLERVQQSVENEYARISRRLGDDFYIGIYINGMGKKGSTKVTFHVPEQEPIELTVQFDEIEDPGVKIEAKIGNDWKLISRENAGGNYVAEWSVEQSPETAYTFRARLVPEAKDLRYEFSTDGEVIEALTQLDKALEHNEFSFKALKAGQQKLILWIDETRVEVTIQVTEKSDRQLSIVQIKDGGSEKLSKEISLQMGANNRYEFQVQGNEGQDIAWESSNPQVVKPIESKDKTKFVFDILSAGQSTVTVREGNLSANVLVNVLNEEATLSYQLAGEAVNIWHLIDKDELVLIKGQKAYLLPSVKSKPKLKWTYSHTPSKAIHMAKFFEIVEITALEEGETVFTATSGEYSVSKKIKVKTIGATKLTISSPAEELTALESMKFSAVVEPKDTTDSVVWSVDNEKIAKIDATGKLTGLQEGKVTVIAKAGSQVAKKEIKINKRYEPKVYFQNKNGEKQYLDAENKITLTVLDEGGFYLEGEGVKATHWDAKEKYYLDKREVEFAFHFWIDQFNRYFPRKVGEKTAVVTYTKDGKTYKKSFVLQVVPSHIEEIKAFVNSQELSMDKAIEVQGSERTWIEVKGRLAGDKEFKTLPDTAYTIQSKPGQHIIGNSFALWRPDTFVIDVFMKDDPQVKLGFKATSTYVPLTDFEVKLPKVWDIDAWNKSGEKFNGLRQYDTLEKGYTVAVTPHNASIHELKWEALTPDIAEYDPLHSNGIVPKKPGIAKFRVSSVDNPKVSKEVEVVFRYKNELESVSIQDKILKMEIGHAKELKLVIQPSNASEQRFVWSYDKEGIVAVSDTVHIDPKDVETPKWTTHEIRALKPGTVKVTGTPMDQVRQVKPIEFTVVVGAPNQGQTITNLQETIDWAHRKMNAIQDAYSSPNEKKSEWKIAEMGKLKSSMVSEQEYLYNALFKDGKLITKSGDLAKGILALRAIGIDPENYYGHNLIKELIGNTTQAEKSSVWGLAPYLWALSSDDYQYEKTGEAKEEAIKIILSLQNQTTGLWGAEDYYADETGFALQALAPYYHREDVKKAVEKAVDAISKHQSADGDVSDNSNSLAMIAVGLWSCDPAYLVDSRLVKNGNTLLHALKKYDLENTHGFVWKLNNGETKLNDFATEQVFRTLIAYFNGNVFDYRNTDKKAVGVDAITKEQAKKALQAKIEQADKVLEKASSYDKEKINTLREQRQQAAELLKNSNATIVQIQHMTSKLQQLIEYVTKKKSSDNAGGGSSSSTITVQFTLESIERGGTKKETWVNKKSYTVAQGSTVATVFEMAAKENNLEVDNPSGNYVKQIRSPKDGNWFGEFSNGKNSGWMFKVNGVIPNVGMAQYKLNDRDDVLWFYTNDYTKESGNIGGSNSGGGGASSNASQPTTIQPNTTPKAEPTKEMQPVFSDVPQDKWYVKAVQSMAQRGLAKGRENNRFEPNAKITRAEFVAILARIDGNSIDEQTTAHFKDVKSTDWYYRSVAWANANQIAKGDGNRFNPNRPITREEMAAMLLSYTRYNQSIKLASKNEAKAFADDKQISPWAKESVQAMQVAGIIGGKDNNRFAPKSHATRAETMEMLYRLLGE